MFTLVVTAEYFEAIRAGKKQVEGRCCTPKYRALTLGQEIRFVKEGAPNLETIVMITGLQTYATFEDYLRREGLERCLPGVSNIEEGAKIYRGFPGYSEKERRHGVLAIQIKVKQ